MSGKVPHTFWVKEKHNGLRLDQFLVEAVLDLSRAMAQELVKAGQVTIDGETANRTGLRLKPGMAVHIAPEHAKSPKGAKKPVVESRIVPKVIADTAAFLVLSKPAGMAMHPVGRSTYPTVTEWISTTYPQILGIGEDEKRPGMVHRLDKDTSGLVLIAKTNRSFKALKSLFQERAMEKTYKALVYGNLREATGTVDLPIGRVKGGEKRAVPAGKRAFGGELRPAQTEYSLDTRYTGYDFLSVKPKTGRTHQIRVHLSALGHPIVGDRLYRFKEHRFDPLKPPFQLLHAEVLKFSLSGRTYRYEAPLPDYFRDALKMLDAEAGRGYDWSA